MGPGEAARAESLKTAALPQQKEHGAAKLDMGESSIRFKKIDDIPHALLGELASKMSVQAGIALYEAQIKRG